MKIRNIKSKCACYAGGIGVCLCTIFMSLGVIGITAVEISKNGNTEANNDMGSMGAMMTTTNNTANTNTQNVIISFFSGFWGEVILLFSFVSMNIGLWFTNNRKGIIISVVGSIALYVSMYAYYSLPLEVTGLVILAFAFIAGFNYKIAKIVKLN